MEWLLGPEVKLSGQILSMKENEISSSWRGIRVMPVIRVRVWLTAVTSGVKFRRNGTLLIRVAVLNFRNSTGRKSSWQLFVIFVRHDNMICASKCLRIMVWRVLHDPLEKSFHMDTPTLQKIYSLPLPLRKFHWLPVGQVWIFYRPKFDFILRPRVT